jgi:hypothetical protein
MQAILFATVLAVLSLMRPPFTGLLGYLSSVAVILVTLHLGAKEGMQVVIGATLGVMVMSFFMINEPTYALVYGLLLWLPAWLLATLLRNTKSLGLTIQAAAVLGVIAVLLLFAMMGNAVQVWREVLVAAKQILQQLEPGATDERLEQIIAIYAWFMTGTIVALHMSIGLIAPLLIGRSWQAKLFNPGGLREEFNQLRFSRAFFVVTSLITVLAVLTKSPVDDNIVLVLIMAYMFYGLAVVHGSVDRAGVGSKWLAGVYVLMLVLGQLVIGMLAALGFVDTWLDVRARIKNRKDQS